MSIGAQDDAGKITWYCKHGVPDSAYCGACEEEANGHCPFCGAYLEYEPCFCHLGPAVVALAREMYVVEWRWMLTASQIANREQETRDRASCAAQGVNYDEWLVPF